jgi:hypothetical protein
VDGRQERRMVPVKSGARLRGDREEEAEEEE